MKMHAIGLRHKRCKTSPVSGNPSQVNVSGTTKVDQDEKSGNGANFVPVGDACVQYQSALEAYAGGPRAGQKGRN